MTPPDPMTLRYDYSPKRLTETDYPATTSIGRPKITPAQKQSPPTRTTHTASRWSTTVGSTGYRPPVHSRNFGDR